MMGVLIDFTREYKLTFGRPKASHLMVKFITVMSFSINILVFISWEAKVVFAYVGCCISQNFI